MLNDKYLMERYEVGDIISYDDLLYALGDGYGDPGCADIATLDKCGWYPLGFAYEYEDESVIFESKVFHKEDYGKVWCCVCNGYKIDGWMAAYVGQAYLLDVCTGVDIEPKTKRLKLGPCPDQFSDELPW